MLDTTERIDRRECLGFLVGIVGGTVCWILLALLAWGWINTPSTASEGWCGTPSHAIGRSGARTVFACEPVPGTGSPHDR